MRVLAALQIGFQRLRRDEEVLSACLADGRAVLLLFDQYNSGFLVGLFPSALAAFERAGGDVARLTPDLVFETIELQARQGVDYMTLHAGVLRRCLPMVRRRLTGIVSRGGALMAQWMIENNEENFLYTQYDRLLDSLYSNQ